MRLALDPLSAGAVVRPSGPGSSEAGEGHGRARGRTRPDDGNASPRREPLEAGARRRLRIGAGALGAFSLAHLGSAWFGLRSPLAFDRAFSSPLWLRVLGFALVVAPLTVELVAAVRQPPRTREGRLASACAAVLLLFVVVHTAGLPQAGASGATEGEAFERCARALSSTTAGLPLSALAHVLGVAAAGGFVALALRRLFPSMRATSRESNAGTRLVPGASFALLAALGTSTVVFFATGSRLLIPPAQAEVIASPTPPASPSGAATSPPLCTGPDSK